jgi:phage tail sheath gpL-like
MGITVQGLPSSRKTPGTYLALIFGGPGTGTGAAEERLMCVGNMLPSDVTGATPSFTIVAGIAALATPIQVFSESDAIEKFGRGSELHIMCAAAFDQDPNVPVWATPVGEAGGAARAAMTIALTGGAATRDYTFVVYCDGQRVEILPTVNGLTVDLMGLAIAQGICDAADLPVTAQYDSTGDTITITAKQKGTRGNLIPLKVDIIDGSRTYQLRTGALAATVAGGTIFTLSAATLGSGTGTETTTFNSAASAMAAERWHRIALAHEDSTNLATMATQITNKAAATSMLWEQMVTANTRAITATISSGLGGPLAQALLLNNPRVQLVSHYNSDRGPGAIAAQVAAARLMGDSFIGGTSEGETNDCAANLDGTLLATIPQQELVDDRPLPAEIEACLNAGVTILQSSPSRPGYTQVVRSITTRFKDSSGAVNYAVLDTSEVTTTDHVSDMIRSGVTTTYARHKLADDSPSGDPPKVPLIVTPKMLKSFIAGILKLEEEQGHVINVDLHMSKLDVQRDTVVRGRCNAEIPVEPAPGFHIFGGNVRQLAA